MSYAPRRAALLSLCVLAILLAASLFPATGFGSAPSVTAPAPTLPDGDDGGDDPAATTGSPTTGDSTATASPTTTDPATTDPATTASDPTTTTTAAAPTTDPPNGGDGSSGAFLVVFAALSALVPIGLGLWLYSMGYRRRRWWLEASGSDADLPDLPPPRLRAAIQSIPQTTMGIVLGLAFSVPDLLGGFATVLRETADGTAMALDGFAEAFGRLAVGLPSAFARGLGAFGSGLGAALGGLPSVFVSLGGGLGDRDWPSFGSGSDGADDSARAGAGDDEPRPPPRTVEEAWARMTEYVAVRNRRAATPTDYARTAIARGYPEGAVERLTQLFIEVRYGGRPADDRTDAALDAFERFRQHAERGDDA